jgi:hypothetical protein
MCALDLDNAHRQLAATADLVLFIADRVHLVADQAGGSEPAFTNLATATDELATLALSAVQAIDGSLALASHPNVSATLATPQHELAISWTVTLEKALDAALAIYARACSELADRLSIVEEHLPQSPATAGPRMTSTMLAKHTRELAATAVTHTGQ